MSLLSEEVKQKLGTTEGFKAVLPILCACIETFEEDELSKMKSALKCATGALKKHHWKDLSAELNTLLQCALTTAESHPEVTCWTARGLPDIVEWITKTAKKGKVLNALNATFKGGVMSALQPDSGKCVVNTVGKCVDDVTWEGDWATLQTALELVVGKLKAHVADDQRPFDNCFFTLLSNALKQIREAGVPALFVDVVRELLEVVTPVVMEIDPDDELRDFNDIGFMCEMVAIVVLTFGSGVVFIASSVADDRFAAFFVNESCMQPLIPAVLKLQTAKGKHVPLLCQAIMLKVSESQSNTWEPFAADLVRLSADGGAPISVLQAIYPSGADCVHANIERFLTCLASGDPGTYNSSARLLQKVASQAPDVFTEDHVKEMFPFLGSKTLSFDVLQIFMALSEKRPSCFVSQLDVLHELTLSESPERSPTPMVTQILSNIGISDEDLAVRVLDKLFPMVDRESGTTQQIVLGAVNTVGMRQPGALAERKEDLARLTEQPATQVISQALMDVVEGRTLTGLGEEVTDQREELERVKDDVHQTGRQVYKMTTTGKRTDSIV